MKEGYLIITKMRPEGFYVVNENYVEVRIQDIISHGDIVLSIFELYKFDVTDRYIGGKKENDERNNGFGI